MISNQSYTKVQSSGGYSLMVKLTEQLKELGISKGDKVYTAVEEKDGKKRIIIEKVER